MATREQLMNALRQADAAGDTQGAQRFAQMIKQQPALDQPVDFDAGTMIGNVPRSAGQAAQDIYNVVRHPIDTGLAINNLGTGIIQKMIPGVQDKEKYADAAGQMIKQRYGSMDNFKTTMMNDPIGVMSDFAGLLSGGSLVAPTATSRVMSRISSFTDPANLAVSGISKAVTNLPKIKDAPSALYKSAAKIPKRFDQDAVTKTALDKGILPTDAGIAQGKNILSDLNSQIDGLITDSVNSGQKINRQALYQHIGEVKSELGGVHFDAPKNIEIIDNKINAFEAHMKSIGKENLTAREVQKFKTDIYKSVNWKAKQGTASEAGEMTRKAMAKGAKDELEKLMPEIKDINLEMGDMLELMDAIDAPAARIANRDLLGLGLPAKVIAGGSAAGEVGAAGGFLLGIADSPTIKAGLAIGLNKIKKQDIGDARKRVLSLELLRNAGAAGQEEKLRE